MPRAPSLRAQTQAGGWSPAASQDSCSSSEARCPGSQPGPLLLLRGPVTPPPRPGALAAARLPEPHATLCCFARSTESLGGGHSAPRSKSPGWLPRRWGTGRVLAGCQGTGPRRRSKSPGWLGTPSWLAAGRPASAWETSSFTTRRWCNGHRQEATVDSARRRRLGRSSQAGAPWRRAGSGLESTRVSALDSGKLLAAGLETQARLTFAIA